MNLGAELWGLLMAMDIHNYYIVLFNQYFPYGLFFWFVGITLFGVIHLKTKNMAYSGMVAAIFFFGMGESGFVINVYSSLIMKYFGLMIGLIAGWYLYRGVKSSK